MNIHTLKSYSTFNIEAIFYAAVVDEELVLGDAMSDWLKLGDIKRETNESFVHV